MNFKNIIPNKNLNNSLNKASLKGEKQILNLDDIVSGKDTRTTVMIRNIPIKYTDEILNEAYLIFMVNMIVFICLLTMKKMVIKDMRLLIL